MSKHTVDQSPSLNTTPKPNIIGIFFSTNFGRKLLNNKLLPYMDVLLASLAFLILLITWYYFIKKRERNQNATLVK
ncbi:unnamed protein product [Adineta steineri]|nr:unnamed protein product [Adineta steineri]